MRCQVSGCPNPAVVRCDNGFALCDPHRQHTHTDENGKQTAPVLHAIDARGEYRTRRFRNQEAA